MAEKKNITLAVEGATVIINGEERDTYCAAYGTQINWSVSKEGYETQSGSFTLTEDKTIDVVLVPTTTYYKFEIIATPSDATVVINGEERTSIEVEKGTEVSWSVSKEGYETQSGSQTITADTTKEIVLEAEGEPLEPLVLTINNADGMETPKVMQAEDTGEAFSADAPYILASFGGSMDIEVNGALYKDVVPSVGDSYEIGGLVSGENVLKFYPKDETTRFAFNSGAYSDANSPARNIVSIDDWGDSRFTSLYYAFAQSTALKSVAKPSKSKTFADLTNASATFQGATGLESIPDGLFADAEKLENAGAVASSSALKTLPNNLFSTSAPVDLQNAFSYTQIEEVPAEWLAGSQLTNARAIFYGCENLMSVGAGVFKDCTACETIDFAFGTDEGATSNLATVGEGVFEGCESVTSAEGAFQYAGLDAIPAKTFKGCKAMSIITNLFYGVTIIEIGESAFEECESIVEVPSVVLSLTDVQKIGAYAFMGCKSLNNCDAWFRQNTNLLSVGAYAFKDCTQTQSFAECFYGCTALQTIGEGLFDGCMAAISFLDCFYGCSGLTSIPGGLFADCTAETSFRNCFRGCSGLTSIPENLFASCTGVTDFRYCFYGCRGLTSIPENLFASCTAVTTFADCFEGCSGLTSIPGGLFASCTAVTTFADCFYDCSGLTSIPENLFASCTKVTDFSYCFRGCSGLTSIPENLFASCTAVTDFSYCFYNCSGLTSISENLFADCTAVTSFRDCFYGCSGLTSIPGGFFASCTKVTDFRYCFYGCSGLTSIPENLFASCTAVTTFADCFYGCSGLTSIPGGLFASCTAVTNFSNCFYNCSGLTSIPENLFASCTGVTDFSYCFANSVSSRAEITGESAYDRVEIEGVETIIHLYERENYPSIYTAPRTTTDCYRYQEKLDDYDNIPEGWK